VLASAIAAASRVWVVPLARAVHVDPESVDQRTVPFDPTAIPTAPEKPISFRLSSVGVPIADHELPVSVVIQISPNSPDTKPVVPLVKNAPKRRFEVGVGLTGIQLRTLGSPPPGVPPSTGESSSLEQAKTRRGIQRRITASRTRYLRHERFMCDSLENQCWNIDDRQTYRTR
jgi:hypothetical protein